MSALDSLYEKDFFAWTQEQARALREVGQSPGSNLPLDWENLAEEIESLGRSQRTALRGHVRRIIRHLLKLEYSPATDPRRGWYESVSESRADIEDLLSDNPSLKREMGGIVEEQMPKAIALASKDLEFHGEHEAARALKAGASRYTEGQVLGSWFPGDP